MKKLFSFLILMIFLFPFLEKGLHGILEDHQEHCAAHEVTHLHEKHHNCKICDFELDDNTGLFVSPTLNNLSQQTVISCFYSGITYSEKFLFFQLRAPPVLS